MNFFLTSIVIALAFLPSHAQKVENRLLEFMDLKKPVTSELIQVVNDPSIRKYAKLIMAARKKDPEWFKEHEKKGVPGTPIPYHENLMSKEDYEGYLKAWDLRKIVPVKGKNGKPLRFKILLTQEADGKFIINIPEVPISTLQYSAQTDSFSSLFGELKFEEVVNASDLSSFRGWTGYKWKAERQDRIDTTRQEFSIGRSADNKFGYLKYSILQSSRDRVSLSDRIVLRFSPVKKAEKVNK